MDELARAREHGWVWHAEANRDSAEDLAPHPGDTIIDLDGDEEHTYQKIIRGGIPVLFTRTRRDTGATEVLAPQ